MVKNDLFCVMIAPVYVHVHPYDELPACLSYAIGEDHIQAFTMPERDDDATNDGMRIVCGW